MVAWTGCGSGRAQSRGAQPFPVHGKVTYQGKPAAGFQVVFNPATPPQTGPVFAPSAIIDADGEYQLRSYEPGDGAPAGDYVVTFTWQQDVPGPDPGDAPKRIDRLKGRFGDARKSTFKVTVHEGENDLPPFNLK